MKVNTIIVGFNMDNRKVDMQRLAELAEISDGNMEVNTTWTIPLGEFTFTLGTAAYTAWKQHHKH
ncbi:MULTISPECIES: hypothetical protein [Lacticaseibacillus]|uniref:hypothetical protein n=2 Tax=Lacticaseibacillus TaxID=2759736 RepID=UPI000468F577|nr:hypothetical protein [Lacticaseibacillus casei]MBI6596602.1 hypothetical protein [Lacticaseibacillus casei]MBO1480293.1 hypothetical protein [Lacticaseibacillus casei]MBO2415474.1 hypothetical protein [Lacticaseibacillus casei]MCK2079931.1 hypothetical protein [Lacticaseibacillus casei]MDZ5495285.1 hypothetical protein [Lacticaseibacillus casei]